MCHERKVREVSGMVHAEWVVFVLPGNRASCSKIDRERLEIKGMFSVSNATEKTTRKSDSSCSIREMKVFL